MEMKIRNHSNTLTFSVWFPHQNNEQIFSRLARLLSAPHYGPSGWGAAQGFVWLSRVAGGGCPSLAVSYSAPNVKILVL